MWLEIHSDTGFNLINLSFSPCRVTIAVVFATRHDDWPVWCVRLSLCQYCKIQRSVNTLLRSCHTDSHAIPSHVHSTSKNTTRIQHKTPGTSSTKKTYYTISMCRLSNSTVHVTSYCRDGKHWQPVVSLLKS